MKSEDNVLSVHNKALFVHRDYHTLTGYQIRLEGVDAFWSHTQGIYRISVRRNLVIS
ncbi:MAG: hypothetical protein J6P40_10315 [Oscillospiraceae bacterium]|nr:hypothetical protein [Oscillospiraceae bacterium]